MRERGSAGEARESPWVLTPGARVVGFTVVGPLASGSFGTVYRARRDGRPFAIKLVPRDARGEREVDALRRVSHPNVVGFHGYGLWPEKEPRFLVLALELVEGLPLDVWARGRNPTAFELVSQVLRPLAGTLGAVHAEGVVHRDVKEANVVMREADGQPVLVDFGAAGYEGAQRLTMRLPPGTPEYRSPEALRFAREWEGEAYPPRPGDDLWALGVTLYWLLTRTLPFGGRHNPRLVQAVLQEPPPPPHELNPRVPLALSALCLRMLEKAPEARYPDAGALAESLELAATEADDSWQVPLFPGGRKQQRPSPAPLPTARARPPFRWWPWAVVLAAALLLGLPPPTALTLHHMTPQVGNGQGFDSVDMTGEVVSNAGPTESPTPAPIALAMHSEETIMFKHLLKSHTTRVLATTCLAGTACASGPQLRMPPEDCPPGAAEVMKRLAIYGSANAAMFPPFNGKSDIATVQEGPVVVHPFTLRGPTHKDYDLGDHSRLLGRVFIGKERVYGRFTELRLPNGEVVPVCLELSSVSENPEAPGMPLKVGTPLEEGSTPERARIYYVVGLTVVSSFK